MPFESGWDAMYVLRAMNTIIGRWKTAWVGDRAAAPETRGGARSTIEAQSHQGAISPIHYSCGLRI